MDDELSVPFVVEIAGTVEDVHRTGRCRQCTDNGCEQLAWAQDTIAQQRVRRHAARAAGEALRQVW